MKPNKESPCMKQEGILRNPSWNRVRKQHLRKIGGKAGTKFRNSYLETITKTVVMAYFETAGGVQYMTNWLNVFVEDHYGVPILIIILLVCSFGFSSNKIVVLYSNIIMSYLSSYLYSERSEVKGSTLHS